MNTVSSRILTQKSSLIQAFESSENPAFKNPSWLLNLRKKAMTSFGQLDFPSTRHEEYKYTDLAPALKVPYSLGLAENSEVSAASLRPLFLDERWYRLVFINGVFSKEFSLLTGLPKGIAISNLKLALETKSFDIQHYLGKFLTGEKNIFHALNLGLFEDGALIYVPDNAVLDKPVHVMYVTAPASGAWLIQPRNLVVLGKNAQAQWVESCVSVGSLPHLTNAVTEIVLEENASLEHYKLQRENDQGFHLAATEVQESKTSRFTSFSLTLGAKLSRCDLDVVLGAEGSECHLYGLYMTKEHQHTDHHTVIHHNKPHGISRQLYKGILDGKSSGVFSGKIFVEKDAQKTDAEQTNKALLLSEEASIDTKPQLEIFANDVKCTHGAAVGQLDPESVFYLKSRGIGFEEARRLLTYGFASEIVQKISLEPLRQLLDAYFFMRFQKDAKKIETVL
jgi:Fe-S cluster assembly protein SufD